jgi:hypothetical protein
VCKDSFSENSVWSEEERWSFEKQQETLSALQKEMVARAFVMALSFTKARPYIVGSSSPSSPALQEEKGAMTKELYTPKRQELRLRRFLTPLDSGRTVWNLR